MPVRPRERLVQHAAQCHMPCERRLPGQELAPELGDLQVLRELDVSCNKLTSIPTQVTLQPCCSAEISLGLRFVVQTETNRDRHTNTLRSHPSISLFFMEFDKQESELIVRKIGLRAMFHVAIQLDGLSSCHVMP